MKLFLTITVLCVSITSFAQTITGGTEAKLSEPFVFSAKFYNDSSSSNLIYLRNQNNDETSNLYCDYRSNNIIYTQLEYSNRFGEEIVFTFSELKACKVAKNCLVDDGEVTFKVDRESKEILEVNLDATCTLDIWAFEGDITRNSNLI